MEESSMGSSPHTRDKCVYEFLMTNKTRITPAYAGQMKFLVRRFLKQRDHPRIRGTNIYPMRKSRMKSGSPPHTRDKWVSGNTKEHKDRITPAYAGQMNFVIDEISIKGDHPRIRGTN